MFIMQVSQVAPQINKNPFEHELLPPDTKQNQERIKLEFPFSA